MLKAPGPDVASAPFAVGAAEGRRDALTGPPPSCPPPSSSLPVSFPRRPKPGRVADRDHGPGPGPGPGSVPASGPDLVIDPGLGLENGPGHGERPEPAADAAELAATGGLPARAYHAAYGSRVPYADLAAPCPAPKSYPDAPLLRLPYPPRARTGFRARRPEDLGDLLALVYGVTRIDWRAGGVVPGRPLPSNGGVYPGELYAAAEFGLCHYLPTAHALERLGTSDRRAAILDCLEARPEEQPVLILLLTSRHEANLGVFGACGHRMQALDSGVLAGQALALLEAADARPRVHVRFDAARLGALLGLDPAAESVRAVVTASSGHGEAAAVPAFSTHPGAQRAALPRRIMARRTAREGFESVSVPLPRVREILDAAALPVPGDGPERAAGLEMYCLARRVDGLEPGCHRRDPATGELVPAASGPGAAVPRGLFPTGGEGELAHFQSACVLLVAGDQEDGYRVHGDRWYRMANLYAGILAQRIGVAATAAGLGSGLRCDYDVAIADRLTGAGPRHTVLIAALIGVQRPAAAPGHRLLLGG